MLLVSDFIVSSGTHSVLNIYPYCGFNKAVAGEWITSHNRAGLLMTVQCMASCIRRLKISTNKVVQSHDQGTQQHTGQMLKEGSG
jgi:hypothetical protein